MRGRLSILLGVLFASIAAVFPARASTPVDHLMEPSVFCDAHPQFRDGPVVVDGPSSQIPVHNLVFSPAFASACRLGSGEFTYLGTGERAGINAVRDRRAERAFGTADVPMSTTELVQASFDQTAPDRRGRILPGGLRQIPIFVGVEAVAFNLTSCNIPNLNLRSPVLSAIYLGRITKWNDPLLVANNPGLTNCAYPIRIIKRADYSGSTLTLKDYLSRRNPEWNYYKQQAQNQSWPTVTNFCPALDEDGMADCISTTQNSIGYIQYHVARAAKLRTARLDNMTSQGLTDPNAAFIAPSPQGCTTAATTAIGPPPVRRHIIDVPVVGISPATPSFDFTQSDWSQVSLADAPTGYPLCSFGYAFMYAQIQTAYFGQYYSLNAARTAVDYLWVAVSDSGQARLPLYDFGSLPPNIADVSRAGLESIRYQT